MAKMGRPKKIIDQKIFENLCKMQCSEKEICDCFEVCEDTLNTWCKEHYKDEDGKPMTFSDVSAQKKSFGRISLRRSQFRLAENNPTMAIWLGKQYLGQSDTVRINNTLISVEDDELTKALKEEAQRNSNANK